MKRIAMLALLSVMTSSASEADVSVNAGFGKKVVLTIDKPVQFPDGLGLVLKSFSHKRPMTGGPTKATAHLVISKADKKADFALSIHGIQGSDAPEQMDTGEWNGYQVQLVEFKYDQSITVVVKAQPAR
jgi:hypothetical protein